MFWQSCANTKAGNTYHSNSSPLFYLSLSQVAQSPGNRDKCTAEKKRGLLWEARGKGKNQEEHLSIPKQSN